jgi:hypothetical protein
MAPVFDRKEFPFQGAGYGKKRGAFSDYLFSSDQIAGGTVGHLIFLSPLRFSCACCVLNSPSAVARLAEVALNI